MKELTIEEKAKAYDESIERAKVFKEHLLEINEKDYADEMDYIFPELKESEDERIRQKLIDYCDCSHVTDTFNGIPWENVRAWLEKQGEQNPISLEDTAKLFLEKLSESPYNNKPITDAQVITKELINFLKDTNTYNPNAINEQKPAEWRQDNVEELTEFENVMMHIGSSFFGENAGLNPNDTTCIKEQANLLLELVPKQEWSEEDEETLDYIIAYIEKNKSEDIIYIKKTEVLEGMVAWLKFLKDRYTWKPSDEQMDALRYVTNFDYGGHKATLVSLYEQLNKLKE